MRTTIIMSVLLFYVLVTSLTMPPKNQSMPRLENSSYNYTPPLHRLLWKKCDLYYVDGEYCGEILPDTNIGLSGNHYFHSIATRIHRLGLFDTDIRIVGAHTLFVSRNKQTGNARITNYDGAVTIYNDKQSIELGTNETLLIDKDGKFERFANEFASADSLWLTAGEIWLNNIDITTLVKRMAINFGCKVQFNYQPSNERVISPENFYFDCKSSSLSNGLKLLQTIAIEGQKFSYYVKSGTIFIDRYIQ